MLLLLLSRQGILRSEVETFVTQPQGVDLKEHFDKVEELKEDIPEWIFDFSDSDLREFMEKILDSNLQRYPGVLFLFKAVFKDEL